MPFKIKSGHISAADCTRYPRTGRLFEAFFMSAKKISEERPVVCPSLALTLWLFNIAIENGPFIVVLPIKNGDFPWLCWITNHVVNGPVMKWGLIEYDRIIRYGRTFEHTIIVIVKSGCGPTPGFSANFHRQDFIWRRKRFPSAHFFETVHVVLRCPSSQPCLVFCTWIDERLQIFFLSQSVFKCLPHKQDDE